MLGSKLRSCSVFVFANQVPNPPLKRKAKDELRCMACSFTIPRGGWLPSAWLEDQT